METPRVAHAATLDGLIARTPSKFCAQFKVAGKRKLCWTVGAGRVVRPTLTIGGCRVYFQPGP